ncbi:Venom serine carboxypeptidase [Eumeta japonica]|uniref:Carboxypeptidase n=1 Tax=Eumeta variegata TaxID=151549 RepID=A0A4C1UBS2_EUMVA|nr:Venom serine carboxypeptidase [Eumeta japonica]
MELVYCAIYVSLYVFYSIWSVQSLSFARLYPRIKLETSFADAGEPLILTPFLNNGSISTAQKLSSVYLTEEFGIESHAGFFTVNEQYGSHHYFWYFPPILASKDAPVLLWLQGGPGATSLFGLFTEIGPIIAEENKFSVREINWALKFHLIFIDNPVGTGFSFTSDSKGYCRDQDCVAHDLYNSLTQFFQLFPQLKNNDFYIAGESYAGKYIPALATKIHEENKNSKKINLIGMAMGNAFCDPINQLEYGKYLYQIGLLDYKQKKIFETKEKEIKAQIKKMNWGMADVLLDYLMDGQFTNYSLFKTYTGFNYYYNYLQSEMNMTDIIIFANLLSKDHIRHAVHVGNQPFGTGDEVEINLAYDILKSVAPLISKLLSHYKILFYNGQLDISVAYPLTENFLKKLNFSSSEQYLSAQRHIWRVSGEIAGYVKSAGNLTEILIRNSGHMVPHDQPKWAYDMITRFVQKKKFW